ncbi:hypothetical protein HZC53_02410 [Candidatus Uhrbacteria bacterium]|nr:hypothetical protein [Candidatus Uhrbacteria bacterium]
MPEKARRFTFESYSLDRATSSVLFAYSSEMDDSRLETYVETLVFPVASEAWDRVEPSILDAGLRSLHLVLGLSYWKMYCAPEMVLNGFTLTPEQARFWESLYTNGMGEFFYKNKIDFRGLVKFPSTLSSSGSTGGPERDSPVKSWNDKVKCLIPIGGGKDSLVTVELVRSLGFDFDLFTLGTSSIQNQTAEAVGKNPLVVTRILDKKMLELSKSGQVYNGHIPITAVYQFTGVLLGLLAGYRYIPFSNERSASQGNLDYLGQEINHQWSKSEDAETLIRNYVEKYITPEVTPFSLLRPLSELAIVERFSHHPKYFPVFSSCNRNFVIGSLQPQAERGAYWCGGCPKCAFVFAMLSAFISKDELVGIFGKDLYADASLLQLYKDLLGRGTCKPFECVGTPDEMAVAMHKASERGEYAGEVIMGYFESEVAPTIGDFVALEKESLAVGDTSTLPTIFQSLFPSVIPRLDRGTSRSPG